MRHTVEGQGAIAWAAVSISLGLLVVTWLCAGCAVGRVDPLTGQITGYAFGADAKLEWCAPRPNPAPGFLEGAVHGQPEECSRVVGGPLLPSLLDGIGGVLKAAWSFLPALIP